MLRPRRHQRPTYRPKLRHTSRADVDDDDIDESVLLLGCDDSKGAPMAALGRA